REGLRPRRIRQARTAHRRRRCPGLCAVVRNAEEVRAAVLSGNRHDGRRLDRHAEDPRASGIGDSGVSGPMAMDPPALEDAASRGGTPVLAALWGGHSWPRPAFSRLDALESASAGKIACPTLPLALCLRRIHHGEL